MPDPQSPSEERMDEFDLIRWIRDRVPADAGVLSCSNLLINESLLTGESVPVRKRAVESPDARHGLDPDAATAADTVKWL